MEHEHAANDSIIDAVARQLEWPFWVPVVVALLVWGAGALLDRRRRDAARPPLDAGPGVPAPSDGCRAPHRVPRMGLTTHHRRTP